MSGLKSCLFAVLIVFEGIFDSINCSCINVKGSFSLTVARAVKKPSLLFFIQFFTPPFL